jgi:sigma-B regulation protein RsbU (phosphoserine phosphatase)
MPISALQCKKIQFALTESEERFRQMAEMTGEWLWEQNEKGVYIYCSAAVSQILGYQPAEIIGKHYTALLTPKDQSTHQQFAHQDLPFYGLINHYQHKDGHHVLTESTGLPIKNAGGTLIKWRGVDRDITAKKIAEQQIRQAQISLAIAHNEITIAQKIQTSLLPSAPIATPEFEVTGVCLPAEKIGGDYFDYFFCDDGHLAMVIADVSGHSIGPALFMVEARSAIRTQALQSVSTGQLLALLNQFLFDDLNKTDYFISLFYLHYNATTRQLSFANAGHPTPLLLSSTRYDDSFCAAINQQNNLYCYCLDAEGMVFGVRKTVFFEEHQLPLKSGDKLLIYTDGLLEAENSDGDFFGIQRLSQLLLDNAHQAPSELITTLLSALSIFCQRTTFNDDITLMVFTVK